MVSFCSKVHEYKGKAAVLFLLPCTNEFTFRAFGSVVSVSCLELEEERLNPIKGSTIATPLRSLTEKKSGQDSRQDSWTKILHKIRCTNADLVSQSMSSINRFNPPIYID